ncbi:Protein PIN-LIKES 2 [Dionaea muscipula]
MFGSIARLLYSTENAVDPRYENLLSAIVPLMELLTLTMISLMLAYFELIPRSTFKLLSKLVFALFLPCLIFVHLGQSITIENFIQWWFIPVNVLISTLIGSLLGYLVVITCRPPPQFTRFTIIMTGFGNTGSLPIAVVGSVCHDPNTPFGPDCHRKGVAFVSFAQWVAVILVYTLVYHMMEPPLEYYEIVEEEEGIEIEEQQQLQQQHQQQQQPRDVSRPLLMEAEWLGIEDKETEHCKTPFIAKVFNGNMSGVSHEDIEEEGGAVIPRGKSIESIRCFAEPRVVRRMRIVAEQTPIRHILQPPTIASLLAIIVGVVPHLRHFIFGYDAPLSFMTDSLEIMAGAVVPAVMLILGGMLAEGPNDSTLGLRTTIGIIVARLVVLPLLGICIVALADELNIVFQGDQMFLFVLLLQYTTPSAILLGAMARLRGYAVSEASAILFWQHVLALVSLPVYIVVYFKLLSYI